VIYILFLITKAFNLKNAAKFNTKKTLPVKYEA